jgi:serine protease Do
MTVIPLPTELQRILRSNANIHGGVLVSDVELNSEAYSIGITKDDIIVQIEDTEILSIDDFKSTTSTQSKKRIYIFRRGNIFAIVL